eukprot:5562198-Pyramimonas_sp.AAC.1
MPNWVLGTHAGGPTGGSGGAPYGATKRWEACGRSQWGLRWGSQLGHETLCWEGEIPNCMWGARVG